MELRKVYGIYNQDIVIGSVGRLSLEKGYRYLLEAVASLRRPNNLKIMLIGNGQEQENLIRLSKKLQIRDKVIFADYQSNVYDFISIFDVFVLSSLTEGFPNVLLEALACKKPVVATNVGAVESIIKHKITGYLINPKDIQGLVNGIYFLLENKDRAQKIANAGYDLIKEHFSENSKAVLVKLVYQEVTHIN
jgi:glycosyltransferase involved in cell wall biosynthesis